MRPGVDSQPHMSEKPANSERSIRVFMMDLWATVPYYTAYLSQALLAAGVELQVGSISYYLDLECFESRGLRPDPGLIDVIGRYPHLPRTFRRVLKFAEGLANLLSLFVRFLFRMPDVIHVQFLPMFRSRLPIDLWLVRFCQRWGAEAVLTVHDLMPHDTGEKHREAFRRLYRQMDGLICHSEHIRTRLQTEFGIPRGKITVIAHGPFFFDLPEEAPEATLQALGVGAGQEIVLWQGIIFPYKGVDLLLNAWSEVEQKAPNAWLVVLGTGDPALTGSLEAQARGLGLTRVRFHFRFCSTGELIAAYRAATVVVYPYRAITTSGALATGLALAKPIVASDLTVFRELLTHGETAVLTDAADSRALAAGILLLLDEEDLRKRLIAGLQRMAFGDGMWRTIAEETRRFYSQVLNWRN